MLATKDISNLKKVLDSFCCNQRSVTQLCSRKWNRVFPHCAACLQPSASVCPGVLWRDAFLPMCAGLGVQVQLRIWWRGRGSSLQHVCMAGSFWRLRVDCGKWLCFLKRFLLCLWVLCNTTNWNMSTTIHNTTHIYIYIYTTHNIVASEKMKPYGSIMKNRLSNVTITLHECCWNTFRLLIYFFFFLVVQQIKVYWQTSGQT